MFVYGSRIIFGTGDRAVQSEVSRVNLLLVVFILGCCVTAFSALGLVFAVSALSDGSFGGFEGRARGTSED